jgi:hypothetical protein
MCWVTRLPMMFWAWTPAVAAQSVFTTQLFLWPLAIMGIKLLVGLMELQTCLALAPVLPVWAVLKVLAQAAALALLVWAVPKVLARVLELVWQAWAVLRVLVRGQLLVSAQVSEPPVLAQVLLVAL